jgi:hypothetical protein
MIYLENMVKKQVVILILILLFASVLRFYRLPEMAQLDFDQEYAANFAYNVVKVYPIQLIGQGLSIEGLFMGPLYFYYLVPFYMMTDLHPLGGVIGSVLLGLFGIAVYFFVALKMFGLPAAILVASVKAISFTSLTADWAVTPAFSSDIIVLITWYLFYRYYQGETKILPILAFIFGLYTSFHPILFPFYLVFLVLLLLKKKLPNLKITLISTVSFIVPILPLIIFEFLHQFWEVRRLFELFTGPAKQSRSLERFLEYGKFISNDPARILSLPTEWSPIMLTIIGVVIFYLIKNKISFWKDSFHKKMLLVTYLVFLGYYAFFPAHVPEYYLIALTTLTTFYLLGTLSLLFKQKFLVILLIIVVANISYQNFKQIISKWENPSLITLYHKDFIVKEIVKRQPQNEEFYVSYIKELGWNFGFNYLFKLYGQIPQTIEARPPIYTIVIPKSLSIDSIDIDSGNVGLILPE